MADLDLELLASIASGGLGRWVQDAQGRSVYVKSEDCVGGWRRRGGRCSAAAQPPTARRPPCARRLPPARRSPLRLPCCPSAGCLRDLQRFFRHDDPEARPAFFAVSKYNFARSDLVPLIVTYPEDYDIVYNARELRGPSL